MIRINSVLGPEEIALLADYAADMKVNKMKRKQGGTIIGVAIGVLLALTVIEILNGAGGSVVINFVAIAIFVGFIAMARKYQVWRLKKYYAKMIDENTFAREREYNFCEDAIKVMTDGVESTYKWNRIDKLEKKEHFYLLYTSLESAMIIDIDKLSNEEKTELDELMKAKGLM